MITRQRKRTGSLLNPKANGGDIAEGGFSFQENMLLARIPIWLSKEGFTDMIREALGDAEARFFIPRVGFTREFISFKNHQVKPSEFWGEVDRFLELDAEAPESFRLFLLVCHGASADVLSILRALRRVRDAFPFYTDATQIQDASYVDFVQRVENEGRTRADADFLFAKVRVNSDAPDAEKLGKEIFATALEKIIPAPAELRRNDIEKCFQQLGSLVRTKKNVPVSRSDLENAIWGGLPATVGELNKLLLVYTANEPLEVRDIPEQIEFDWAEFFGGEGREYPPTKNWQRVLTELQVTRDWILTSGRPRRIRLSGSRRLSTSLAVGSVFSAVSGFSIEVEHRDAVWMTDDFPATGDGVYGWSENWKKNRPATEIAVGIGIMREISADVERFLANRQMEPLLILTGNEPLRNAREVNQAVAGAKGAISKALSGSGATRVHLFFAGPSHFAVFLGHRLNATAEIQCYERTGDGSYTPTSLLTTT